MEVKLDGMTLDRYNDTLNAIFNEVDDLLNKVGTERIEKYDLELIILAFEGVIKACSMYNNVVKLASDPEEILSESPRDYITYNLDLSKHKIGNVYRKYKRLI